MYSNFNGLKTKTMDITANDFFRQQYFAATWNKEQMDKTTMSPNDCIKMMELYHQHKLKLLGIADVVGQSEQLSQCKCGNTVQVECDDCKDDRIRSEHM